jgi:release factor glutamine methyltransferase
MKTIGEVIQLAGTFLTEKQIERPRRIAEELLSHILQMKKMDLYLQYDRPIIEEELTRMRELLKQSAKGVPLAYVVGEVEFYGCKIKVDHRVLIPRPETELLVEKIAKRIQGGTLWDLCTGSGCIGIALKKALPQLQVTLADLSPDVLALAAENAKANGVEVEIVQGDFLTPFQGCKADYIVSNPPYVTQSEYFALDSSVRDHEPQLALVAGERGTEFYEQMAREEGAFTKGLYLEIGASQGEAVKQIFGGRGEILKDLADHSRFFFLEKQ